MSEREKISVSSNEGFHMEELMNEKVFPKGPCFSCEIFNDKKYEPYLPLDKCKKCEENKLWIKKCLYKLFYLEKESPIEVETCKNVTDMHPVDEFICSSCGIMIRDCSRYEFDEDTEDETCYEFIYKYCPRCGKRIVYEETSGNE